jgi:WD40 repeat protein
VRHHQAGGKDGGDRQFVFISYCRADAGWVQRFNVLLKPLLRARRIRLWSDTEIRVGDSWDPQILNAIDRSLVALLLVSADFLASDYVMERELVELVNRGVRLAPVLIGNCYWQYESKLADVQWLRDPREGPLSLVSELPGERDRRMMQICDALLAITPDLRPDAGPRVNLSGDKHNVAEAPMTERLGSLHGVPSLPPGYVVRDDLQLLIDDVVAFTGDAVGVIGVTGAVRAFGLHGQGGIGKSVLAAALAHDNGIRRRFPDGIFWITLGEGADIFAAQLSLLESLGAGGREVRNSVEALDRLRSSLRERRVLLVVDDVWSDAAAQAFRATGGRGRIVYTSRDPQTMVAVQASRRNVGVLSLAESRGLAAAVVRCAEADVPSAADQAFGSVGYVPLAVALLAAAARDDRTWDGISADLIRDVGIFADHPYANTFKAMQIAVASLSIELADSLLSLAVFPPDTRIPLVAVQRYWLQTRSRTSEETILDLDLLAEAKLLDVSEGQIGFHDLQHDYLLLHAPELSLLHAALLDAYRALLPPAQSDQWWQASPREPYLWDHLVRHLRGAGDRGELGRTVTDARYLVRRVARDGAHAAEFDLSAASAALPLNELVAWWQGWTARHSHYLTTSERYRRELPNDLVAVVSTFNAWLSVDDSRPDAVDLQGIRSLLPAPRASIAWGLESIGVALFRVLTGHSGAVIALDWSPDNSLLATADGGEQVKIWDSESGQELYVYSDGSGPTYSIAWSPDGTRLAIAGAANIVKIWSISGVAEVESLTTQARWICALKWSADGSSVAAVGKNGIVDSVDVSPGGKVASASVTNAWIEAAAWSGDGSMLALSSKDDRVLLWSVTSDRKPQVLDFKGVNVLAWSPDAETVAIGSKSGQIRLFDRVVEDYRQPWRSSGLQALAWSPDGSVIASGGKDGRIRLWPTGPDDPSTVLGSHADWIYQVAWAPNGSALATTSRDGQVRLWNTAIKQAPATPRCGGAGLVQVSCQRHGKQRIATIDTNGEVGFWDSVAGHQLAMKVGGKTWRTFVSWSPNGNWLAVVDGSLEIWNMATGRRTDSLRAGNVIAAIWAPDGGRLAVVRSDRIEIRGFDERERSVRYAGNSATRESSQLSGSPLLTLHLKSARSVSWSPSGNYLAVLYEKRQPGVWSSATGEYYGVLPLEATGSPADYWGSEEAQAMLWLSEVDELLAVTRDGSIKLCKYFTSDREDDRGVYSGPVNYRRPSSEEDWIVDAAWSSNGKYLALGGSSGHLSIWQFVESERSFCCLTVLRFDRITSLDWTTAHLVVGTVAGLVGMMLGPE